MTVFRRLYHNAREFFVKYPAVLSGYFIYSYFFIATMKFFLDEKRSRLGTFDIFERFDSLLWMWLLSVALVKIIDIRTKLHERETEQLRQQRELALKQTQLSTLVETVRGLQHEVNNPLTIILMTAGRVERLIAGNTEATEGVRTIRTATERIANILDAFARAKQYEVDTSPLGPIAKPPASHEDKATGD
jgi:signal transduction histidine kinase